MVTKEKIKEMAAIAMLSFDNDELELMAKKLSVSIDIYESINEVDTKDIEPTYQVNDYLNPIREDIVMESLPQKEVIKNTVEEQFGYFKILKVVD